MKSVLSIIVVISFIGQVNAQGLIFDATEFSKREKLEEARTELPASASLKKYAPLLYPQVGSTCVAHSFANAKTILYAKKLNWTDREKITRSSFSPYYIYFRNRAFGDLNCERGLKMDIVAGDVLSNGIAPLEDVEYPNYYPFTDTALCVQGNGTFYPPSMELDLVSAQNFRIEQIYRVISIEELKTALASEMPIILCMFVPNSFYDVKGDIWTPTLTDSIDTSVGHAIVAVGYDDTKYGGAFEIMNSWGPTWGDEGFTWIKYKDYPFCFLGGYALYANTGVSLGTSNNMQSKSGLPKIKEKTIDVKNPDGRSMKKFDNSNFVKSFNK